MARGAAEGLLQTKLEEERARRVEAEEEVRELRAWADEINGEVVIAFGKVEEVGEDFGSLFREALALNEAERERVLHSAELQTRILEFRKSVASMGGITKEIIRFDGDPEAGGRFFASAYRSVFELNERTTKKLEGMFREHIKVARARELTLRQAPTIDGYAADVPVEEQASAAREWLGRRQEFYRGFREALREELPEGQRESFDQWVELDGIGFNNVMHQGRPIGFTLGGKQTAR